MTACKAKRKEADKQDDCTQIDCIIGPYGKYQFMIFLFKILIGATSAMNNLGVSFYAPSGFVSFWCADLEQQPAHFAANLSRPVAAVAYEPNVSALAPDQFHDNWPHSTGARAQSWTVGQVLADFVYNAERAQRRSLPSDTPRSLRKECTFRSARDNRQHKCSSYNYDTGIWMSTIIDEWDLVCDRSLYVSVTQSLYMAGFIVAYLLFGYLSDRFGRWNSLLLGSVIEISSGFGCAFASSVAQFMLFRFLLGLGNAGRSSSSYLIMIEWTGPQWRMHISTLGSLGWVISYCTMPWLAKFFLHFRHMQLFVCFYELALVVWLLCLPESPRWLLTHRRFDRAHQALLRAAKFNGLIRADGVEFDASSGDSSSSSGDSPRMGHQSGNLLRPAEFAPGADFRKLETRRSFARKRLNSISLTGNLIPARSSELHADAIGNHQQVAPSQQQQQLPAGHSATPPALQSANSKLQESIILAPTHEVATHVELANGNAAGPRQQSADQLLVPAAAPLAPYSLREFDQKFAQLVESVSRKEFTKNEHRLSFVDLLRWTNLRRYTLILAFAWCCNSFIYYGIALRVGDFGGTNLFVSFCLAGATELPSILFTLIFMKFLPRRLTNMLMFSIILALSALQVPLQYYDIPRLQQASMILAKLFNSCSFICILYQTMELFPTSIRQTAYSSCALAGRVGSILAPFVKELSQLTNSLIPPVVYAVLSLLEILLTRRLPETQGSDMPDTLLEAEKFKGTGGKARK